MKKRTTLLIVSLTCAAGVLAQACSQAGQPVSQQETSQTAATVEPKPSADSFIIKGVLVDKAGAPAVGKTITVHPLDKKGAPLFISVFEEVEPGKATPKPWNPKTESGPEGRFQIEIPRISRLGDDPVTGVSLGLGSAPPGGWVMGKVSKLYYVNPDKKEELCFIKEVERPQLLRKGNEVAKVSIEQAPAEIDLGQIGPQ